MLPRTNSDPPNEVVTGFIGSMNLAPRTENRLLIANANGESDDTVTDYPRYLPRHVEDTQVDVCHKSSSLAFTSHPIGC